MIEIDDTEAAPTGAAPMTPTEDTRTEAEREIMGSSPEAVAAAMTDTRVIVGDSGARYRLVDFFNEMPNKQRRYATRILRPVLPLLALAADGLSPAELAEAVNLPGLIGILADHDDLDVRFLAAIYLPDLRDAQGNPLPRQWDGQEGVEKRMEDFGSWTLAQTIEVFQRFFASIGGLSGITSPTSSPTPTK